MDEIRVHHPGPLPWELVPVIGQPRSYGFPGDAIFGVKVDAAVICGAGHVNAVGGLTSPSAADVHDLDEYHGEYAARWAARGKEHRRCIHCGEHDQKVLVRTANRLN